MLGMKQVLSYITSNLEQDISLYVKADMMASNEERIGNRKAAVKEMIPRLKIVYTKLDTQRSEAIKELNGLNSEVEECQLLTDSLQNELISLEQAMRAKLETKQLWNDIAKASFKTLAVAASICPVGQPAIGQVLGNSLNAISDGIGEGDAGKIAASAMGSIDLSGTMEAFSKRKIKALKKPGKTREELEILSYQLYGLKAKTKEAKANQLLEKSPNMKKINEYDEKSEWH